MAVLAALLLVALVPLTTYVFSLLRYKSKTGGTAPSAPHWIALIAHTAAFVKGDEALARVLRQSAIPGAMVRFHGLGFNFVLLSGADFIRKALSTHNFDWNKVTAPLFAHMFAGPPHVVDAIARDDSGVGRKPYPGSSVPPGRRLLRNQIVFFADAFSRASIDGMVPRFVSSLQAWCEKNTAIGANWVEMDDLYGFVREMLFACGVESFFGPGMLEVNPGLAAAFWAYDDNMPFLAAGMPGWMKPRAARSRTVCHEAMKRWRAHAVEHTDPKVPEDAAWDSAWGLGAIRRRNKLLDEAEGLFDENARAAMDLALLWTLATNVIPASYWYLVEVLAHSGLADRVRRETDKELGPTTTTISSKGVQENAFLPASNLDARKLTANPLLQSIYAETLRLHVATLLIRTVKKAHSLGAWNLPHDESILVSSHVEHFGEQWDHQPDNDSDSSNTHDQQEHHPATQFWPERFLVPSSSSADEDHGDEKPPGVKFKFSLSGRQGQWLPFGLGEHMCPGRHFAKQEMILSASILLALFDVELRAPPPANDFARYGFGTLGPKGKLPFRVRRRVGCGGQ
ncbi:cytochrome P450 [Massariosphaeria phaeospora]|uniref:Cytochrome P450 n=1 Tax=Massariosphaeria phaeospora TaxID=100035 RepID=A0A7C8MEN3_9PLEO|nr:cytochrome P450 [Massariosphaeria phaeospora]